MVQINNQESSSQLKSTPELVSNWLHIVGLITVPHWLGIMTLVLSILGFVHTYSSDQDRKSREMNADAARLQNQQIADSKARQEKEIARDNQQHQILSDYLKQMTTLLIDRGLRSSVPKAEVRSVARAITLNAARQLDGERKGQMLKFLYEGDLLGGCPFMLNVAPAAQCQAASIVDLGDVKLEETKLDPPMPLPGVDLKSAFLSKAELPKIDLTGAKMDGVDLVDANLTGALLNGAQMSRARLQRTNLTAVNLTSATLTGADLREATLIYANLRGANLSKTDLTGIQLEKAVYDSETKFPDGFIPLGRGMCYVKCVNSRIGGA